LGRRWLGGQELLDGVRAGPSLEADLADRRQLVRSEGRVLGLELVDRLAVARWQGALILDGLGLQEALHPQLVEAIDLPVDGAGGNAGLLGSLDGWCAEDHDGPDQLIASLLRPIELELELFPIVGGFKQGTFAAGHPRVLPIPGCKGDTTGPSG